MTGLPTGTVTFLFTDIEGSSALLQRLGDRRYAEVLAEHRRLLRAAFEEGHGQVVDTQGDAFLVAFSRARDALGTAVAAQRALTTHSWPDGASLRVRMGLHTGEPVTETGGYVGLDVHRAARICSAGRGGQILLSDSVRGLAARDLPPGVTLRDLGTHRLKDLQQPEHLLQVVHPDLPGDFPPLKSLDARPNNLPRQLTSFIGREKDMADVKRLLSTTYLVTLTGSGGAGKTRLALQVAAELLDGFPDGAWLIGLAAVSEPSLVVTAISSALGVPEQAGRSPTRTLEEYLRPLSLLLVLDNCEHVLTACAELADSLLRACPHLRILATSREALGVPGENAWRVPSLSIPNLDRLPSTGQLMQYEAVRLFVDRAGAGPSKFILTSTNASAVVEICKRLEGIPLAIELAAARAKVMTVEQIASRLDDRFRLLTGGSRTVAPRHQTLRAAMDWSYDLLSENERVLLRRLSVFSGGWTLDAAGAICAGSGVAAADVLDLLTQLVDKSLVTMETHGEEARYRMLGTVRQYGWDRLLEAGEAVGVRKRHLDWFLGLAEQAEPQLRSSGQPAWLERLQADYDNFRVALEWSKTDEVEAEAGLRLAGALLWFSFICAGHVREELEWLEALLSRGRGSSAAARAKALCSAGALAWRLDEYERASTRLEESVGLLRQLGDHWGLGFALHFVAHVAMARGDYKVAARKFEESIAYFCNAGDDWGRAYSLGCLASTIRNQGDDDRAGPLYEESVTLFRKQGDLSRAVDPLAGLAAVAEKQGQHRRAVALAEEGLSIARQTGQPTGTAIALFRLAQMVFRGGDYPRALALFQENLVLRKTFGSREGVARSLEGLASVALAQALTERAARLFGAADAMRELIKAPLAPADRVDYDRQQAALRKELDEIPFQTAWAEGRAMTSEQAIEYALEGTGSEGPHGSR